MNKICTICCQPIKKGQAAIEVKTKGGTIHAHQACMDAEQRELKAAKEAKA